MPAPPPLSLPAMVSATTRRGEVGEGTPHKVWFRDAHGAEPRA
jgi:hypothetical protein